MLSINKKAQAEFNQVLKDTRIKNEEDMVAQRKEMTHLLERERAESSESMEKTIRNHNEAMEKLRRDYDNAYLLL